jgi:hypothetical protein
MKCEICSFDEDAAPLANMNTVGKVCGMLVCRVCERKAALMELRENLLSAVREQAAAEHAEDMKIFGVIE